MSLNDLTRKVTSFASWYEFAEAMHGGYVPTLSRADRHVEELADRIEALGFKVWRGLARR